jgi:hypothetical protein
MLVLMQLAPCRSTPLPFIGSTVGLLKRVRVINLVPKRLVEALGERRLERGRHREDDAPTRLSLSTRRTSYARAFTPSGDRPKAYIHRARQLRRTTYRQDLGV